MKKTTQKGKRKAISLREFRAWLDGVEELQPQGWHPTQEQWMLIRTKIDCIEERENLSTENQMKVKQPSSYNTIPTPPSILPPLPPSGLAPSPQPYMPPPPTQPVGAIGGGIVDVTGRVRTPNIDTTQNGFESPFE